VIQAGDRDELVISSQRRIHSYSPETGEELWMVRGNTFEVIPTPVVGHGFVFVLVRPGRPRRSRFALAARVTSPPRMWRGRRREGHRSFRRAWCTAICCTS
jgi:hypothetical protein